MAQYALVKCNINGKDVEKIVDVRASLTDMLRNDFRLTSVKRAVRSANAAHAPRLSTARRSTPVCIWLSGPRASTLSRSRA